MKAVLMSIKPEWCEKIASGKKTVEVRKNRPKLEAPFKVYIYCTLGRKRQLHISNSYSTTKSPYEQFWVGKPINDISKGRHLGNGKVIGEFVCDFITNLSIKYSNPDCKAAHKIFPFTCMTDKQIMDYLGNGKDGCGLHISNLVIYEKPKELFEFTKEKILPLKEIKGIPLLCDYCLEQEHNGYDELSGTWYNCGQGNCFEAYEKYKKALTIKHPPQSWCYVNEVSEDENI